SFDYRVPCHASLHSFPTRRSSDLRKAWKMPTSTMLGYGISKHPRCCKSSTKRTRSTKRHSSENWNAYSRLSVSSRACCLSASFRSEEHTSELQSRENLVCRLLLEK